MGFPAAGGSVLVCYRLDERDAQGNIVPHGYVREYHLGQSMIRTQLQRMYQNGQRRLGVAIPFLSGGSTFDLDCTTGLVAAQDRQNLAALLSDAIACGFEEFVLEVIPEWDMSYDNWMKPEVMGADQVRPFQPLKYGLLLSFVYDLWQTARIAVKGKANLYIDLLAECANTEVGGRLWLDWCALFPDPGDPARRIGFSQVPVQPSIDNIPKIYPNGQLPLVWNVHAYNGEGEMTWTDYKRALKARYPQGIIIGETSTNDLAMAAALAADPSDLFWLLQWPVLARVTPPGISQDRLTIDFDAYRQFAG